MFHLKYIPWVVIDVVTFQEGQKLVFETPLLMVLLLLLYVVPHGWRLGMTHCECTIASLPSEFLLGPLFVVDPLGRTSLDVLKHLRNSYGLVESSQNVDVICRTANFQKLTFLASDDSTDVRVEVVLQTLVNAWDSIFRAEDDVIRETGVGAHGRFPHTIRRYTISIVPLGLLSVVWSVPQVETWGYLPLSLRDILQIPPGPHGPKGLIGTVGHVVS